MSRFLWTQKEDIGPSARFGHAMTYDPVRSRTILFGGSLFIGNQVGTVNDTWEWNGEFWTQIADTGPAARRDHALCFDSVRNTALLFGGLSEQGTTLGDTWSWDGEDWTQVDDSGPSARSGHAMVFDSARGRAVLFGGGSTAGLLNDTWEWDGQAWTQQEDTGPSPRWFHALVFDLVRNRVVLFGGNPGNGPALGDTWSWDGSTWTQTATFGANPCFNAAMVSTDVQIALFGGVDSSNAVFRETWVLDGKHWTQRQDIGPVPRYSHAMSYDAVRRTIVLFGGHEPADSLLRDTWEHIETDPAQTGGGAGVDVLSVSVNPTSAFPGDPVVANISLTSPAPAGTQVELSWATQNNPTHTILTVPNVPNGAIATSINFVAPSVFGGGGGGGGGGPILIFARTVNSAQYASTFLLVSHH
jgi:galactose oxidase-like protein